MTLIRQGWADVGGRRVHYAEAGAGPAVVIAPGLGLSTRFYEPTLACFAREKVRLVVPDLPGFGQTHGPLMGMSIEDTAGWLLELADRLGLERPAWLGHSVGCQAALAIAATHPDRAAALVLAAPTGAPGRLRLVRQVLSLFAAAVQEPLNLLGAVVRDYVRVSPTAYLGTWLKAGLDQPVDRLPCVRCPTLLLVGRRDPIVPRSFLHRLETGIDGARIVELRGGLHGLPRDAAPAFAAAATSFVREAIAAPC